MSARVGHFHSPKMLHNASEISKSPASRLLVVLPQPRGLGANLPRSCGCFVVILPRARGCFLLSYSPVPAAVVRCRSSRASSWRRSVCSFVCVCVCVCACPPPAITFAIFLAAVCSHLGRNVPTGGSNIRPVVASGGHPQLRAQWRPPSWVA